MKKILLLLVIHIPFLLMANAIDKINTQHDVIAFLAKYINKKIDTSNVFKTSDSYQKMKSFYKLDIDHNGLTDLLVNGVNTFYVLDMGKGNYSANYLDRGAFLFDKAVLSALDTANNQTKLVVGHVIEIDNKNKTVRLNYDTLIFKFGGFIELNNDTLQAFNFQSVSIETDQCFGTCPIFTIKIEKNGNGYYKATRYNDEQGEFTAQISQDDMGILIGLLKYINPYKLKSSYSVNWTDDQKVVTTIEADNKKIEISDYGKIGTYGLARLYRILFSWRKQQQWEAL